MEYIFPSVDAVPGTSTSSAGMVLCGVPAYFERFKADKRSCSAEPCWVREEIPDVESFDATFLKSPKSVARAILVGVRVSPARVSDTESTPRASSWVSSCGENSAPLLPVLTGDKWLAQSRRLQSILVCLAET